MGAYFSSFGPAPAELARRCAELIHEDWGDWPVAVSCSDGHGLAGTKGYKGWGHFMMLSDYVRHAEEVVPMTATAGGFGSYLKRPHGHRGLWHVWFDRTDYHSQRMGDPTPAVCKLTLDANMFLDEPLTGLAKYAAPDQELWRGPRPPAPWIQLADAIDGVGDCPYALIDIRHRVDAEDAHVYSMLSQANLWHNSVEMLDWLDAWNRGEYRPRRLSWGVYLGKQIMDRLDREGDVLDGLDRGGDVVSEFAHLRDDQAWVDDSQRPRPIAKRYPSGAAFFAVSENIIAGLLNQDFHDSEAVAYGLWLKQRLRRCGLL